MPTLNTEKICLIYNFAQHYRSNIFQLIDKEFDCDFVFGDKYLDVKKMDYSVLSNVKEVENFKLFGHWYYQKGIIRLIKKYKTFIFVGDVHCVSTWIFIFIAKLLNKRVFFWAHGWYGREGFIATILKKIYFGLASGCMLYGDYAKKLMIKKGFNKDNLHVIYNSLDYDKQIYLRESIQPTSIYHDHFNNKNKNIVFVGRLTEEKRLDMLLDAISKLKKNNLPFNLTLIGNGEKKDELQNRTCSLNLHDNVWFYGACYDEQILASLLYNADICVSPGNVGLTAMHSMVFGTPVITHDNFAYQGPEFEAIQKGLTGDFFKQNDIESLCDTIEKWITQNKNSRNAIRQYCYNVIDTKYNPHVQVEIIKNILNNG